MAPGDIVQVRGKVVDAPERTRLWRYHKPDGLVTTHRDPEGRPTVFERLPPALPRVVSVGRLDLNSEGLLLLTNDGALARKLELPSNGWIRRYRVRAWGVVDERMLAGLARGHHRRGRANTARSRPRWRPRKGDNVWLSVALTEGRNREVRRVMAHLGLQVNRLIRVSYGPFQLGNLELGAADEVPGKVLREQLGDARTHPSSPSPRERAGVRASPTPSRQSAAANAPPSPKPGTRSAPPSACSAIPGGSRSQPCDTERLARLDRTPPDSTSSSSPPGILPRHRPTRRPALRRHDLLAAGEQRRHLHPRRARPRRQVADLRAGPASGPRRRTAAA